MGNMMRVPRISAPAYQASFIPTLTAPTAAETNWEGRPNGRLSQETRQRIADLIDRLISLLDLSEPDNEDVPVFPGHTAYQPPSAEWTSSRDGQLSGLDVDREADDCDDEPDADDEPDYDGEADADLEPGPGGRPPAVCFAGGQMIWETSTIVFKAPIAAPTPLHELIRRAGK